MFPRRIERLAALAVCLTAASVLPAQERSVFRAGVTLVNATATVKDATGALVGSLTKDDFEIYDSGVKQEIAVFSRQTEQPLSVALMIDTSGSTGKDLKYETDSAGRFLQALLSEGHPADAVSLYGVNADVTQLRSFTHSYASLAGQFKYLRPEGATALYDAIYLASEELEGRDGRKVIVIVTDGDDTYSKTTARQALQAAHMADAVIYPIVVVPITNEAGRNIGGEHVLEFMAKGTGGRTFMPSVGPDLDRAFAAIISELRTEYVLGFYPRNVPAPKDGFHPLEVRAKRPDLKVSARNGYYGDVEKPAASPDARVSVAPSGSAVPPKSKKK